MLTLTNYIFAISGAVNCIFSLVFCLVVYSRGHKGKVYSFYYLTNLSIALWAFGYTFWQLSESPEQALFWCRIFSIGSTLIPIFMLQCELSLTDSWKKHKKILIFGYVETIIFLIFNFTPFFVNHVEKFGGFTYWPMPGVIYHFYIFLGFFGLLGWTDYLLYKDYRESSGAKKEQIKYATIALLIPIFGGGTNFPFWYKLPIPPWGNLFVFLFPVLTAYVISTYRLMDIKLVIGKMLVYVFSLASTLVLGFIALFINTKLKYIIPINILYALLMIAGIYLYQIFLKIYEIPARKYFYGSLFSRAEVIRSAEKALLSTIDLHEVIKLVTNAVNTSINPGKFAFLLKEGDGSDYKIIEISGFDENEVKNIFTDSFFINYLDKSKSPLSYDELLTIKTFKDSSEKESLANLQSKMKKNGLSLCLPLFTKDALTGLIILGDKRSGENYLAQDVNLLSSLTNQISVVIENARLYDQVQDLSQNLQQKVDEQTRELRLAYQTEKEARLELEKLDQTKNQFLLAVQHHLRTPLTVIKWNSDIILGGKAGKQNKKTTTIVERIQNSTEGLIKMVNEFLDITQFQLGKQVVNLKPNISLVQIFDEILQDIRTEAEKKNITLDFVLQNKNDKYEITADREKLKAALFNIADNAVKYTEKGSVQISLQKNNNFIEIKIRDTGIGITKEEQGNIFDRAFQRGDTAQKTFATGRGIGLYISSQIIKAHNGKILAYSDGPGKGSCFTIEIGI